MRNEATGNEVGSEADVVPDEVVDRVLEVTVSLNEPDDGDDGDTEKKRGKLLRTRLLRLLSWLWRRIANL